MKIENEGNWHRTQRKSILVHDDGGGMVEPSSAPIHMVDWEKSKCDEKR